ncbi:MAG: Fic family protein [Clostridia bacterium]|nr:Fic family protein [Clostridia bacterium]
MKQEMQNTLGFFWEGEFLFSLPQADSVISAVRIFKQNLAPITWHSMTTLENNPTSLPQTETILKGQSVNGISINDLMQVKNYGDGARLLIAMFGENAFALDTQTACSLHNLVGREDALTWGVFRNSQVNIGGIDYNPPHHDALSSLAENGFAFLQKKITSPIERAFAVFLFMARTQFFHDANKRTASLMMNGVLLQNAYYPAVIMNNHSEEFHATLRQFYNSGDASSMMEFFARSTHELYPQA